MIKKIKYLPLLLLFVLFSYIVVANIMSWQVVTLQQVQTVSSDSLLYGKDWSPRNGDSVQFTCRVVAAPQVIIGGVYHTLLRGTSSWQCYAQDTANGVFGGIVIRQRSRANFNTNIQYVDTGNIITVKGVVQEFWSTAVSGIDRSKSGYLTQLDLDSSSTITINSIGGQRPIPKLVNITNFAIGDYPNTGGSINYVDGEKYEGMYVEFRNVVVGPGTANRQPFSIIDANGNKMYVRDFSNFYSTSPSPVDTVFQFTVPSQGTVVNYIRGVIINSNNEGAFGNQLPYVIVPLYPNDISLGGVPPQLSGPNKTPGVPTPVDSVSVNVTIQSTTTVTNASVYYRINGGAFVNKQMTLAGGNIYATKLPPTVLNNLVEYYFSATNTTGLTRLLPADTSISKLFYKVKASDSLSIQEVQYCPNNGGRSGYENAIVRGIEGVVTADTIDFYNYACGTDCAGGPVTNPARVIIQNGTGPFSGIWIAGSPTDQLRKGQKVRVSGTVTYSFGINQIMTSVPSDVQILSSNNTLPAAEILPASILANSKSGGDLTIKKWESVLVKINSPIRITCIQANRGVACFSHDPYRDSTFRRNFGEFLAVDNSNTEARILLAGGRHRFSNNWDGHGYDTSKTLLTQNDSISFIQGILYYAYGNYKISPRSNTDFGNLTPVGIKHIEGVVQQFKLNQNYPNPFNPVTRIGFTLPMYSKVTVRVYDVLGRQVQTLVNDNMNAGSFLIDFNGSDFASGVYFVRMTAVGKDGTSFADTKKMLLVK